MTVGIDFNGNSNSAVAGPLTSEGVAGIFSGTSAVFSFVVVLSLDFSVEVVDIEVSKFTQPKWPSRISNKEEVSVPARAILIHPIPSCLN